MITTLSDLESRARSEFEILAHGHAHIADFPNRLFSFDDAGMRQRWECFDRVASNVLRFVRSKCPQLSEFQCESYRDLLTVPVRDEIERIANRYLLYRSICEVEAGRETRPCHGRTISSWRWTRPVSR